MGGGAPRSFWPRDRVGRSKGLDSRSCQYGRTQGPRASTGGQKFVVPVREDTSPASRKDTSSTLDVNSRARTLCEASSPRPWSFPRTELRYARSPAAEPSQSNSFGTSAQCFRTFRGLARGLFLLDLTGTPSEVQLQVRRIPFWAHQL